MAVFTYSGFVAEGDGAMLRGTIAADSPRQARDRLRDRGLLIQEMAEVAAPKRNTRFRQYLTGRQSGHVTGFLQELATLLGAGIPLMEALDTISRQHRGRFHRSLLLLREHV